MSQSGVVSDVHGRSRKTATAATAAFLTGVRRGLLVRILRGRRDGGIGGRRSFALRGLLLALLIALLVAILAALIVTRTIAPAALTSVTTLATITTVAIPPAIAITIAALAEEAK